MLPQLEGSRNYKSLKMQTSAIPQFGVLIPGAQV
jgi:hypothetical protein